MQSKGVNKTSVMIFGASELQRTIINAVNRFGYISVAIDPDPKAEMRFMSDFFYCVKGDDIKSTINIIKKHDIKGIATSGTEKPLRAMSLIAEKMGFIFPSSVSIANSIDKYKLKCVLKKNNIPCADGIIISSYKEIKGYIKKIKYPVVIKPSDNSGSRGVFYCESPESLLKFYNKSKKYSSSGNIIIEEYIKGQEVSVECLTFKNKTSIIQITDKLISAKPYFVEMGHSQPSGLPVEILSKVKEIVVKTINALGLNNCASHAEIKITKDGPKVIEIGPRLGGDYITAALVPASTGVNMEEQIIKICLNMKPDLKIIRNHGSAIRYLLLKNGIVNKINPAWANVKKLPFLINAEVNLRRNCRIKLIENSLDRYGFVIAKGRTRNEAIGNSLKALHCIKRNIIIK